MFKLIVLVALVAFASAKPTTLLTSPAIAGAPLAAPLTYAYNPYNYGTPLAYTYPGYYRTGLAQIGYEYAPLAYY